MSHKDIHCSHLKCVHMYLHKNVCVCVCWRVISPGSLCLLFQLNPWLSTLLWPHTAFWLAWDCEQMSRWSNTHSETHTFTWISIGTERAKYWGYMCNATYSKGGTYTFFFSVWDSWCLQSSWWQSQNLCSVSFSFDTCTAVSSWNAFCIVCFLIRSKTDCNS